MVVNGVSDWFQSVPLQLLSDTIEHTLHSVRGGSNMFMDLIGDHFISLLHGHPKGGHTRESNYKQCVCGLDVLTFFGLVLFPF